MKIVVGDQELEKADARFDVPMYINFFFYVGHTLKIAVTLVNAKKLTYSTN